MSGCAQRGFACGRCVCVSVLKVEVPVLCLGVLKVEVSVCTAVLGKLKGLDGTYTDSGTVELS